MKCWQNVSADYLKTWPEKPEEWHRGYLVGCEDFRRARPATPLPGLHLWSSDARAGYEQAQFDCALGAHPTPAEPR